MLVFRRGTTGETQKELCFVAENTTKSLVLVDARQERSTVPKAREEASAHRFVSSAVVCFGYVRLRKRALCLSARYH